MTLASLLNMSADTTNSSSESILRRIASGDKQAVEDCLDCYGGLVWSLARKYLVSTLDAEDASQEIFVEIWQHAGRYDPALSSETTFITMIARRRLIDRLRRAKSEVDTVSFSSDGLEVADTHEHNEVDLADEAAKAAECLKKLSLEQRKILQHSIHDCFSQSKIASSLKMPLGTVKSFARRGLIQLRDCMARSTVAGLESTR